MPRSSRSRTTCESAEKIGDRVALLFGGKILLRSAAGGIPEGDDPAVRQFVEGRAAGPADARGRRWWAAERPVEPRIVDPDKGQG